VARRSNIGSNTRQISTPSKARKCSRKRVATAAQRRRQALKLLASCRDGCTEAIMLAHGFTIPLMVELVRGGLATATAERVRAGSRAIEVATLRITEAGRRALGAP